MNDKTKNLQAAVQKKSEDSYIRAIAAIQKLTEEGMLVSFSRVSKESGLSRTYLYNHPELRALIENQRDATERSREISMNTVVQLQKVEIKMLQAELKAAREMAAKAEAYEKENLELKAQLRAAYKY